MFFASESFDGRGQVLPDWRGYGSIMAMVYTHKSTTVRRRQIASAARKLIVKYGSEHVTVRRMAREIGVSEGAIYRHFRSKKDILSFLVDDIENTLIADIERNHKVCAGALETLESVLVDHMSAIEQRRGVSFQVIAEIVSLGDKKLNKKIHNVIDKYLSSIRSILAEGVQAGVIRPDIDLDATASLFFGMVQGLVNVWALSFYSFNLEQKYIPLWHLFREAIIKR